MWKKSLTLTGEHLLFAVTQLPCIQDIPQMLEKAAVQHGTINHMQYSVYDDKTDPERLGCEK